MSDKDKPVAGSPRDLLNQMVAEHFNHGDPEFYDITADELDLYNKKNKDYAGGGNDPNGNFNRVAAFWALYPDLRLSDPRVVAISHAMKQIDQILWSINRGYEGEVEGLDPRFADVHIYFKIARVINRVMGRDKKAIKTPFSIASCTNNACVEAHSH